jgi:hypothetical protein
VSGIARRIELFNQAYRLAWEHFSQQPAMKEKPKLSQLLHDYIRRELGARTTDPVSLAAAAIQQIQKLHGQDSPAQPAE